MIIGLAGAKHSGKNTAAQFIKEEFGNEYYFREWSFAKKLKVSAAAIFGIPEEAAVEWADRIKESAQIELVDDAMWEGSKITGREFLQRYGTEAHRDIFGDDFWVDALFTQIINTDTAGLKWEEKLDVITDARFPNEADAIHSHGGSVLEVHRFKDSDGDTHASEKPLPPWKVDRVIGNYADLGIFETNTINAVKLEIERIKE
jgi:hypothetical protein